jgi:hypothetical protein
MQKCQDVQPIRVLWRDALTLRQINNEDVKALIVLQTLGIYVSRITSGARIIPGYRFDELKRFNNHPVVSLLLPIYHLDDVAIRQLIMIAERRYEQFNGRSKIGQPLVVSGANILFFAQNPNDCSGVWKICLHSDIARDGLDYIPSVSLDEYTHQYLQSHRRFCSNSLSLETA